MTDLPQRVDRYLESRLTGEQGYLTYYDKTARRMKQRHLQTRTIAAIGAVLIPVISQVDWPLTMGSSTFDVSKLAVSVIGLGVAMILALEGVYHYKEQWQNFRGAEQYLLSQRFRFENRIDDYEPLSDEAAFKLFVSRVEKAILDENNVTLNILGRTEAATAVTPVAPVKGGDTRPG